MVHDRVLTLAEASVFSPTFATPLPPTLSFADFFVFAVVAVVVVVVVVVVVIVFVYSNELEYVSYTVRRI